MTSPTPSEEREGLVARIKELEAHCTRLGQGGAERYWEARYRDAAAEITRLRAEVARKDAALKPFDDDAAQWDESPECDDDHPIGWDSQLTIGDLRRARSARMPAEGRAALEQEGG